MLRSDPPRSPVAALLADATIRQMLALAASLVLMIVLTRLPLYDRGTDAAVGWVVDEPGERIALRELAYEAFAGAVRAVPPAPREVPEATIDGDDAREATELVLQEREAPPSRYQPETMQAAVFAFSEIAPKIVGGLQAFYIHIEYPELAREAGIEGRLVLNFIVEPDGRATDIDVVQSLHPLCDSAAVRALRRTRFVPGVHNGEDVRVRMSLPVRFRLLERDAPARSEPAS